MLPIVMNKALRAGALAPTRRGFLKAGGVAGAGLVIGSLLPSGRLTAALAAGEGSPFEG